MALKKEKEVLNDIEEKDQYGTLHDFTAGKKHLGVHRLKRFPHEKKLKRLE